MELRKFGRKNLCLTSIMLDDSKSRPKTMIFDCPNDDCPFLGIYVIHLDNTKDPLLSNNKKLVKKCNSFIVGSLVRSIMLHQP